MLQPIVGWLEFHDVDQGCLSIGPDLSKWPTMADPSSVPLVQLPHVMSGKATPPPAPPTNAVPSGAVSLLMLFASECRSATLRAMSTPFALYQGPLPMRSRAFT